MDPDRLIALGEAPLGPFAKGVPPGAMDVTMDQVGDQGWHLLGDDLVMPVAVLSESSLSVNISTLQDYCKRMNVSLAPHGKTTMAPQLFSRQLHEGAWALSAAVPHQAKVYRAFGVSRVILANQLVDPVALDWILGEIQRDPQFEFYCFVDSDSGLDAVEDVARRSHPEAHLNVLVELGYPGGRSGCRSEEEAVALASAAGANRFVELAGVAGFEGTKGVRNSESLLEVDEYLRSVRSLVDHCLAEELFGNRREVIVTAGGSIFFDRVAEIIGPSRPGTPGIRTVVRSGAYVAHDAGFSSQNSPTTESNWTGNPLISAFQVWGSVLSRPESDLALLNIGRRDVGTDAGMPVPQQAWRRNREELVALPQAAVTAVHDQHAFVRLNGDSLDVGDLVGCGISHPCTNLDKWEVVFVVDDNLKVIDAIRTFF